MVCAGLRLDLALRHLMPQHSRNRLQESIKAGAVRLNGVECDAKTKVWAGDTIQAAIVAAADVAACEAQSIPLECVYEDDTLLVINKPAGLVTHPGNGNRNGTLLNALLHHEPALQQVPRAGIVHRLDKSTSGLLVVAKTLTAQVHLVRQMQARNITREYLAVVHGQVRADGLVCAPIGRHPIYRTRMAVVETGKVATTHYHVLRRFSDATLLECRLETGRTHQIRVHLQSIGHALMGDTVYCSARGRKTALAPALRAIARQALHAARLQLVHPVTGATCLWEAPLPEDMLRLLALLEPLAP
jgi:23S rRNA pseudouridine1911/1915/1917 synthase